MVVAGKEGEAVRRIAVKEGLLTEPYTDLSQVRLSGKKCQECGEALFGSLSICQNCGSEDMRDIVLSPRGKLWTYTVMRHRPPGDFKGPDPFEPFGIGLVELPEGVKVLSPLTGCDIEDIKIGTDYELVIGALFVNEEGEEVISYKFQPVKE